MILPRKATTILHRRLLMLHLRLAPVYMTIAHRCLLIRIRPVIHAARTAIDG